MTLLEIE